MFNFIVIEYIISQYQVSAGTFRFIASIRICLPGMTDVYCCSLLQLSCSAQLLLFTQNYLPLNFGYVN